MAESDDSTNGFNRHISLTTDLVLEMREIGRSTVETVDARRLHAFLENGDAFSNWIGDRIRQYDFLEGTDFVTFLADAKKGRPAREYAVTLDMAKELSMVERNAKGKQARRYFIECEKRAKASTALRRSSAPRIDVAREHRLTHALHLKIAKMCGLTSNQAILSANKATAALTGVDTLGLMGITHLDAPQDEVLLTPSDLANRSGLRSAQKVNLRLCELGLQEAFLDAKHRRYYEPTQAGLLAGGIMQDTGKRHSTGTPVRQLKWASSVLQHLGSGGADLQLV